MDIKRVRLGMAAWFLAIIVPVAHHVLLHWPLAGGQTSNVVSRSEHLWGSLPTAEWVYVAAMALVGLPLVLSGLRARQPSP